MTGTSMASPYVAGVVGLMLAANPQLTAAQIGGIIRRTAAAAAGRGLRWRNDAGSGRDRPEALRRARPRAAIDGVRRGRKREAAASSSPTRATACCSRAPTARGSSSTAAWRLLPRARRAGAGRAARAAASRARPGLRLPHRRGPHRRRPAAAGRRGRVARPRLPARPAATTAVPRARQSRARPRSSGIWHNALPRAGARRTRARSRTRSRPSAAAARGPALAPRPGGGRRSASSPRASRRGSQLSQRVGADQLGHPAQRGVRRQARDGPRGQPHDPARLRCGSR